MAMRGQMDVGSLASYLVFVRQAALPINQFTMQSNFLLAALRGQRGFFRSWRLRQNRMKKRKNDDSGKCKKRGRRTGSLFREDGKLGFSETGRKADSSEGGCAFSECVFWLR